MGSSFKIQLAEQGYVPDTLLRKGIRDLLKVRLQEINAGDCEAEIGRAHV